MNPEPFSREKVEHFMEIALREAKRAEKEGEVPVGAVLATGQGKILAKAHNRPISMNDPTAHAEILVLREAAKAMSNYRLPGTCLFVTLEPCIMCAGALVWARVERVFFGACDPKAGALGSVVDVNTLPGINHRLKVLGGIRQEECARLLTDFFRKRR